MPKILILGCTGYIGQALAARLTQSGIHVVYGLARTPEKARLLSSLEVIPVEGSVSDSANYLELIQSESIDIVIDVAGAYGDSKGILEDLKRVGKERIDSAVAAGVKSPKLGFIYCSGIWVHGSSASRVNDLTPVGIHSAPAQPPTAVAWRPKLEQEIIAASDLLDTMVVRPALVYGRTGTIWGVFFGPILQAIQSGASEVSLAADLESRPALIHVDDVATGFEAAIKKLPVVAGTDLYPIFDLVTSHEPMLDILSSTAKALGFKGKIKFTGSGDDTFMQAMNTSVNGSSSRAVQLLGWSPSRIGMAQKMDIYANAWLAAQS